MRVEVVIRVFGLVKWLVDIEVEVFVLLVFS